MMKKMLLCVGLMGLVPGNVQGEVSTSDVLWKLSKGLVVAVVGYCAYESAKETLNDIRNPNSNPTTRKEDVTNVAKAIGCTLGLLHVAGGTLDDAKATLTTGILFGAGYLILKQFNGAKNLKLREYVVGASVYAIGKDICLKGGIPVLPGIIK